VKLTLPFGVISDAYYTRLNINTAVWCGVNLEFARGIQEIVLCALRPCFCSLWVDWSGFCEHHRNYLPSSVTRWLPAKHSNRQLPTSPSGARANNVRRINPYCFCTCWQTISRGTLVLALFFLAFFNVFCATWCFYFNYKNHIVILVLFLIATFVVHTQSFDYYV